MPGVTAVTAGDPQPAFDLHYPMMSLPLAFGTELATIPAEVPYLRAPPDRVAYWASRLPATADLRVGLVWAGNPAFAADRHRSVPFERLMPLLATAGVSFVALQRDVPLADAGAVQATPNLLNLGPLLRDFADTAAVISLLDLVIAVDTAPVHLAGALGRPVWVMLSHSPDFRWMLDRPDSPWYPTARLFRQPRPGDWAAVVAPIGAALGHERQSGARVRAALLAAGRYDEALGAADHTLAVAPDAGAHNDRGTALAELGRSGDAHAAFGRAIDMRPSFSAAIYNQGLIDLTRGDYAQGWPKYEQRFAANRTPPPVDGARWTGAEPIAGKTVLIAAEQGLGDSFQFVRYVPMVAARGANVILAVTAPLAPVMATLAGSPQVVRIGDAVPAHDFAVPLLSLPHAFGTTLDTIPAQIPYLAADPARVAYWQDRLPPADAPRIGLAWSGTKSTAWAGARSIVPEQLEPLLRHKDFRFVSLQRHLGAADASFLRGRPDIVHFGEELRDFADTAAIIASLDLVISIDTAVAHLAGAMARPLWVMLPCPADFRWLLDRADCPWYPSARLFRQSAAGDWARVIARMAEALSGMRFGRPDRS